MIDLLIIGNGFLGNNLQKNAINQGLNSHLTDYRKSGIDIRNISNIEGIINQEKPRIIINCAAISNIDLIENNSDNAFEVNAVGAKNLAIICEKLNLKLVHISTDSVFDGRGKMYTENDIPNPINEYSKSKKMGEDLIKKYLKKHVIVRTNFYGKDPKEKNLYDWVKNQIKNNSKIIGFDDIIFNPLEINNLSKLILELMETDFTGTIHLSNNEILSKYEFCKIITNFFGYSSNKIQLGSIKDVNLKARRPLNTTLSNKLSTRILNTKIITLKEYLNEYET
tara:strand:+ start:568 stop:1410 length:843 start_codon:yes stop_codon:yes gene_type:complete